MSGWGLGTHLLSNYGVEHWQLRKTDGRWKIFSVVWTQYEPPKKPAARDAPPVIDTMSLLIIRHGETALNVARVLQPADTPLSARGIEQAEALAHRLSTMNVSAIVSSDLPRALRTAQAIAAATGAPIETSALLQERNFGDWRGQPYDGMAINPLTMLEAPPGGESVAVFATAPCTWKPRHATTRTRCQAAEAGPANAHTPSRSCAAPSSRSLNRCALSERIAIRCSFGCTSS